MRSNNDIGVRKLKWTKFQTYDDAPTKAFEILCNQLFENWCYEKYKTTLSSFHVVNGAGGDGGVESYAVLSDGNIVGLQAKWFLDSITSNQMGQIKNSIKTAMKIRPNIIHYIVCIPRDLASLTGKGENTEGKRWEEMKSELLIEFPDLVIDLWNDTKLTSELQKDSSSGIFKFWFERAEISEESVKYSFEKSKKSWLSSKYVSELNSFGTIHDTISACLGDIESQNKAKKEFDYITNLCNRYISESDELMGICEKNSKDVVEWLNDAKTQIQAMLCEIQKIQDWLENETIFELSYDEKVFWIDFNTIIQKIKESKEEHCYYFHFYDVIKTLQSLSNVRIIHILNYIKKRKSRSSLIFLGEPGTGKTHGAAAETEKILSDGYHVSILIQARDIPVTFTWKDIIVSGLGLSDSWSEGEIWQGLSSLANRKRFSALKSYDNTSVLPKILIIIDGIDESSLHEKWLERVQETSAIVNIYPCIRFCFMSRPYVFKGENINGRVINLGVKGDVPVHELFEDYIKAYNIDTSNSEWVKYALTTPLALKLFCELNEGKSIEYHSTADVSIASLLKEKIKILENEYCKNDSGISVTDQYIFKSILLLTNLFNNESNIEKNELVKILTQELNIETSRSKKILIYLENYGVLRLYCKQGSGLLSPDEYLYFPGIQGYFDYCSALTLLDKYQTPQNIDFSECNKLPRNTYYILAIISIREFAYLITNNFSIKEIIDDYFLEELLFFSLRHIKSKDAKQYKTILLERMTSSADSLRIIVNKIVLPLSRDTNHLLGVSLLDEFLSSFEYPAKRDILWSVPSRLKESEGEKWYSNSDLELEQSAYHLSQIDVAEGLPTVFAWALSSLDNKKRKAYRVELMRWASIVPNEFYKLFLKFSDVNDPQIRSDVFSILMSLLFKYENLELLKNASEWLMQNVLEIDKLEKNRDISIRHYATSIIRKAQLLGLFDIQTASKYLPPFNSKSHFIELSEEALSGTYMGGYSGISYDLGRYVLIDHITVVLPDTIGEIDKQYTDLVSKIAKNQPAFADISSEQLILSAAFAFITKCGWNEKEFEYYNDTDKKMYGVDCAISRSYSPKTHGEQSPIMTVCEKCVWQARNYISGFLSEHLMYSDDDGNSFITDYGLLDDFIIPSLEFDQIDPKSMVDAYPWHIPEEKSVIVSDKSNSREELSNIIRELPSITWEKWIQLDNINHRYPINSEKLIAINGYSCFESLAGIETNLYICSVFLNANDVDEFINQFNNSCNLSNTVLNPSDWRGGCNAYCYISPQEICWMPWKKRYDSSNIDYFPKLKIYSTVDNCTYNFIEYGDVSYKIPSTFVRGLLEITDTNGYQFYDCRKQVKAINVSVGEEWHTQQNYLLVDKEFLKKAEEKGYSLVWIMREHRFDNGKAREKFGDFNTEKDQSYVGYFKNGEFVSSSIILKENEKENKDNIFSELLDLYKY